MRGVSAEDSVGGAIGGGSQYSSRRDLLLEVKCNSRSGDGMCRKGKNMQRKVWCDMLTG
jgi:hypothetical protein